MEFLLDSLPVPTQLFWGKNQPSVQVYVCFTRSNIKRAINIIGKNIMTVNLTHLQAPTNNKLSKVKWLHSDDSKFSPSMFCTNI